MHREMEMNKWMRRIRGAIGMGLAWAMAWFGAGLALLLIVGPDAADVPFPLGFGALGFFAGVFFSGVLGMIEGRRRFEQMSVPRFAVWGGAGGFLLSIIFVPVAGLGGEALLLAPLFTLAGAACASGSLALARMAKDPDAIHSGADSAEMGPGEDETRERVGGRVLQAGEGDNRGTRQTREA
jgi:hypothetical protein